METEDGGEIVEIFQYFKQCFNWMGGDRRWWRRAGQRFHPSLAQSTDLGYEHKWPARWHLLVTKVQSKYTHTRTHMHTYTHKQRDHTQKLVQSL